MIQIRKDWIEKKKNYKETITWKCKYVSTVNGIF